MRLVLLALLLPPPRTCSADSGTKPMLHIDWRRLPDRPVGTQDSAAGVLGDDFVVVGGNRGRVGTPEHVGQAGMYNGGQAISIAAPSRGWRNVTAVPATTPDGHTRQGFSTGTTASVALPAGDALVFAGGFSHTNCSRQAFLMLKNNKTTGGVTYRELPSLPWDIAESNLVGVGSKVFSIGGADCGLPPNTERFLTWSDRWGGNQGFGKRVLVLDLAHCLPLWAGGDGPGRAAPSCAWQHEADFPVRTHQLPFCCAVSLAKICPGRLRTTDIREAAAFNTKAFSCRARLARGQRLQRSTKWSTFWVDTPVRIHPSVAGRPRAAASCLSLDVSPHPYMRKRSF